jgi:hypothetical protein
MGLLFKLLVVSTGISVAVKYGGGYLPIAATNLTALILVLSPTILLALALGWRWQNHSD